MLGGTAIQLPGPVAPSYSYLVQKAAPKLLASLGGKYHDFLAQTETLRKIGPNPHPLIHIGLLGYI